jgi:hypothetical protein
LRDGRASSATGGRASTARAAGCRLLVWLGVGAGLAVVTEDAKLAPPDPLQPLKLKSLCDTPADTSSWFSFKHFSTDG